MTRRMLLYDIPDDNPLPRQWLDQLDNETVEAHIIVVERLGPAFSGCRLLEHNLWALEVEIGYGRLAQLIFMSLPSGDLLAIHGFTSTGRGADREYSIAADRKRDLIG